MTRITSAVVNKHYNTSAFALPAAFDVSVCLSRLTKLVERSWILVGAAVAMSQWNTLHYILNTPAVSLLERQACPFYLLVMSNSPFPEGKRWFKLPPLTFPSCSCSTATTFSLTHLAFGIFFQELVSNSKLNQLLPFVNKSSIGMVIYSRCWKVSDVQRRIIQSLKKHSF